MSEHKNPESARHTPGPWEVFEGGNFVKIVAKGYHERRKSTESGYVGGPLSVGEAQYYATENYDQDHEKALANARLMAAAPDLLQTLKAILDSNCLCFACIQHTEQARVAIAKAEDGGTQK